MNVIARLEFQLTKYDVAVQHVSHYATGTHFFGELDSKQCNKRRHRRNPETRYKSAVESTYAIYLSVSIYLSLLITYIPLRAGYDKVNLVCIQKFSSPNLVALPKSSLTYYIPTPGTKNGWIHAFPKYINGKWNVTSHVQDFKIRVTDSISLYNKRCIYSKPYCCSRRE